MPPPRGDTMFLFCITLYRSALGFETSLSLFQTRLRFISPVMLDPAKFTITINHQTLRTALDYSMFFISCSFPYRYGIGKPRCKDPMSHVPQHLSSGIQILNIFCCQSSLQRKELMPSAVGFSLPMLQQAGG